MPKEFKHPDLDPDQPMPLRYGSLAEAKTAFLKTYEEYEAYYKANPEAVHLNSMFGPLDKELWDLMHRKHFHHHFEQFGVLVK